MRKWFYFYTPDYGFWHEHLQETLGEHFDLRPLPVDPASLRLNEGEGHHFRGCPLKIELLIDCIAGHLGETVMFTDCTLTVNGANDGRLAAYVDSLAGSHDLVFADNGVEGGVNIGVILVRCSRRTLAFWTRIRAAFGDDGWDQRLVNQALGAQRAPVFLTRSGVRWSTFDAARVVCGYRFDEALREEFLLYKQFIHPAGGRSNWNERLQSLNSFGLLDDDVLAANLQAE